MYQYTDFDRDFLRRRAAQYRDQYERWSRGELSEDEFKPLRLQNGWYIQRHAPMLRVAIPYGELSSRQLRTLARIAREFDRGYGHFTTRQNIQYNWIALKDSPDVLDRLAAVDMHGIQTSGNCIRNITTDALAGVAPDEIVDPRPYCELLRQWSTLHPEFAYLPRKFKIAVSGAREDRAAIGWHDVGLQLRRRDDGEVGFEVRAGGGMGRTPLIAPVIAAFVPWREILVYLEAVVRVYNRYGRRDNLYKARIKILVKAEGERFARDVQTEFERILRHDVDGDAQLLTDQALAAVAGHFDTPAAVQAAGARPAADLADHEAQVAALRRMDKAFDRWVARNVHAHRVPGHRAVTLSLKRPGQAPGDATDQQMQAAADLADRFSQGELRVSHDQNLVLPWVRVQDLPALHAAAREGGFAHPNIGLLTDMIACPGGDFCGLANARSIPVAEQILQRYTDADELFDLGDIDLHISGCINSCGHHHSGHIGILGVDKDGQEWYQVTLGGSDGSSLSGAATPGKVIGPAFAADEVADVVDAVIDTYRHERQSGERFIDTLRRTGMAPFQAAAQRVRRPQAPSTAPADTALA